MRFPFARAIVLVLLSCAFNPAALAADPAQAIAWLGHRIADRGGFEFPFFLGVTLLSLLMFQRRKWIGFLVLYGVAIIWLAYNQSVVTYLDGLGADSFAETRDFDLHEAGFWLSTVSATIRPEISIKWLAFYTAASACIFACLQWLLGHFRASKGRKSAFIGSLAILASGISLAFLLSRSASFYLDNSDEFLTIKKNYSIASPPARQLGQGIPLLVYIGESTTPRHMNVYGYPRQTTPELSRLAREDRGLLVFHNVLSTHAHTSQSLLEAFSFPLVSDEAFLPIAERKRLLLASALKAAGVGITLVSNQGRSGSWNQAASIVFGEADRKIFSTESSRSGNSEIYLQRPYDHDFFADWFGEKKPVSLDRRNSIVFFHSYAGHGNYLDFIPEAYRKPVDAALSEEVRSSDPVVNEHAAETESYDSTIRYIDHSVGQAIEYVKSLNRAAIFVYFSDHGEIPGLGHDSARFRFDMARVPLLIYFNEKSRSENPALFARYQSLARQSHRAISTLAQLPSTLLDLLGIEFSDASTKARLQTAVVGMATSHAPILVRRTAEGISFINVNNFELKPPRMPKEKFIDMTDSDARSFVASVVNGKDD